MWKNVAGAREWRERAVAVVARERRVVNMMGKVLEILESSGLVVYLPLRKVTKLNLYIGIQGREASPRFCKGIDPSVKPREPYLHLGRTSSAALLSTTFCAT